MLSRRRFLLGTGAAAVLVACGDDGDGNGDDPGAGGATTTALVPASELVLGEAFDRNGLLVAGIEQRAPFVLFEATGGLVRLADAPAEIAFTVAPAGGEGLPAATVARRGDDVDRPYYPLVTTFPAPGEYTVSADLGDGEVLRSVVVVNDGVDVPQVGDALPVAQTPTVAAPAGVQTVCTDDPVCPFHEVSLDAALTEGRPTVVMLSTPAYCQVAICGPVLDLLIAEAPSHPELAVVHIEVYPNGAPPAPPTALVSETFGLQYEPALFVADATGTITARLDNIYDRVELTDALATATA